MAHTRGPVHLSLEDKTSQRKEWPKGDFSETPAGPCGCDGCTWRPEWGRSTTNGRAGGLHWVGHVKSFAFCSFLTWSRNIFLIYNFFPTEPYSFLPFIFFSLSLFPLSSALWTSYSSSLFSYFLVLQLLFFLYLEPFYFLPVFQRTSTAGPICLS